MEEVKPKTKGKRVFFGLTRLIALLFVALIIAITSSFVFWSYQSIHQELDGIERDISRAISDASSTFFIKNPFVDNKQRDSALPLLATRFLSHPSPFSARDILKFKKQYDLKTYFSMQKIDTKMDVLAGYSNVVLKNGLNGDEYLSLIIWVNESDQKHYDWQSDNRIDNNHIWLVYHTENGSLQPIFINLHALPIKISDLKPGERIGEISGFIATSYGETSSLKLDSSIKGSILKGYDNNNEIVISFRMRLDSPRQVDRPNIDIKRPIGVSYVPEEQNKSISSFQLSQGVMRAAPYATENNIQKILESFQEEVINIELVNSIGVKKSFLERPGSDTKNSGIVRRFIRHMVSRIVKSNETYSQLSIQNKENGRLVFSASEYIQANSLDSAPSKLKITFDSTNRLEKLIDNHIYQLLSYTALTLFILVILIIFHLYVVKRMVRLSMFLADYQKGTKTRIDIPQSRLNDEISVLSEFLDASIKKAEHEKIESDQRYKRRGELMGIMGHDIRTPIAAIMTIHKDDPDTLLYARRIERASNTILEVGTLDNEVLGGKNLESIEMGEFIQSLSLELETRFDGAVEYKKPLDELMVLTNAEMLEDAVDCIVNNAIDFSDTISFHVSLDGQNVQISISNNGVSIDESILNTLFEYGVSKRKESDSSHHGIGLFSSALRINILGGSVSAQNVKNGVTFIIKLPCI